VAGSAVVDAGMVATGMMAADLGTAMGAGVPGAAAPTTDSAVTTHDGHDEKPGATKGQREDVGIEHERETRGALEANRAPRTAPGRAMATSNSPPLSAIFRGYKTGSHVRLKRLAARGFRNLVDIDCELPTNGVAILGANGQGKTNLLEALYYPVLFRSLRGAPDHDVGRFGGPGFQVEVTAEGAAGSARVVASYTSAGRKKRTAVNGEEIPRLADAIGHWLAVAFLPADVGLSAGPAAERRRFLDRLLALSDRQYYTALARYRAALAQRNGALRGDRPDLARAFDRILAQCGAVVTATRLQWVERAAGRFAGELESLGEPSPVCLRYHGRADLADSAAWPPALDVAAGRDKARRASTVGPHRDDLVLELSGRSLRSVGSTGQQRTAAVALKLLELDTLTEARETQPALLLDDVFAELDAERQQRFAQRLGEMPEVQVFVTAPRADELPSGLELERWRIDEGRIG
jgi:DNA replication and repair protein RecF